MFRRTHPLGFIALKGHPTERPGDLYAWRKSRVSAARNRDGPHGSCLCLVQSSQDDNDDGGHGRGSRACTGAARV